MEIIKKLLFLLTPQEQKRAGLLLIMILIMAFLDTIGVASILPFIAVLTNSSLIETNLILNTMYQASGIFGVETNEQFFLALGILVLLLLIISLTFKALTDYALVRFVQMREYSIGKRLIEGYLNQPYSWFLNHHSAELGKNILSEVEQVIGNGIRRMMELISKGVVAIALIILLILADPKLALTVSVLLGGAYGLIFYFIRVYLKLIGKKRLKNNELRFTAVGEAFGAAKEVKVGGLEQTYIKKFSNAAELFALTKAHSSVIAQLPRFILEAIAFGGVMLIVLYMISQTGSLNNALPIISLYVFAGYRLMPALQQIYASLTQITFVGPSLDKLYSDLKKLKPFIENQDKEDLLFNKTINLKNVSYNYPNSTRQALKNINLSIPVKTTIGLIGATGSGKTTTVDIILGLLEAQNGTLEVDDKIITKHNSRSWQRSIGYVPQHIYLSDDTIAANIAFGISPNDINQNDVEKASKIANLHNFVMDELPEKYQTTVGERGVRLSGGQRQRIGISRALYHNPKVLILDEATSALDNQTEQAVMDAINNLDKKITIILIAHRLNTVKNCDKIFLLEKGQLKNEGTFKELII
ncbi:ABC transporter ATP-binding protein/permease [Candidatus Pelagibacter bacterium]|nr:ABC transporter ATP-binding protein/permease [Candidatus Pelagibacter bacterium]